MEYRYRYSTGTGTGTGTVQVQVQVQVFLEMCCKKSNTANKNIKCKTKLITIE
jgi:hypothetical protein